MQSLLKKLNQDHVDDRLNQLSAKDKKILASQINRFDTFSLLKQKKDFFAPRNLEDLSAWTKCHLPSKEDKKIGEECLKKGQVALVLLAGGQGTRFGFSKSKGCFPVTAIKKKTLFQLFCEKIKAAQKKYQVTIPLAIMVSPLNENEIFSFFEKNHFFGLEKENVFFFKQNLLPFLDENGKWIFSSNNTLAMGPDGNGDLFYHLLREGIYPKLIQRKIQYLSIFSVDNPLVNPLEESLIGHHKSHKNEVTIRSIKKEKNMGLLAEKEGKVQVVEYFYLKDKKDKFLFANANHFIVTMSFVEKMKDKKNQLNYHLAKKRRTFSNEEKIVYKSEKFLFDTFAFASKVGAVLYPKKECFSPLKNKEDIPFVQKDLLEREREILINLGIKKTSIKKKIELSQEFYFPTQALREKCKKNLDPIEGYIQETDLV